MFLLISVMMISDAPHIFIKIPNMTFLNVTIQFSG